MALHIEVRIYASKRDFGKRNALLTYRMDHDDKVQREVLGRQCRSALEAGQIVVTIPMHQNNGENDGN